VGSPPIGNRRERTSTHGPGCVSGSGSSSSATSGLGVSWEVSVGGGAPRVAGLFLLPHGGGASSLKRKKGGVSFAKGL